MSHAKTRNDGVDSTIPQSVHPDHPDFFPWNFSLPVHPITNLSVADAASLRGDSGKNNSGKSLNERLGIDSSRITEDTTLESVQTLVDHVCVCNCNGLRMTF